MCGECFDEKLYEFYVCVCAQLCGVWAVGASSGSYSEHLQHFIFSLHSKVVECSNKKSIALNASSRISTTLYPQRRGNCALFCWCFHFSRMESICDFIFTPKYEIQTSLECGGVPLDMEIVIRNPSIIFPCFHMEIYQLTSTQPIAVVLSIHQSFSPAEAFIGTE